MGNGTIKRILAAAAGLVIAGCVSTGGGAGGSSGQELSAARAEADKCRTELKSARENNALLIETNARLTSQLQAGKLDSLAKGADLGERLSECEFRTRELEASVMEKEKLIGDLELEVVKYSAELRDMLEERQAEAEEKQMERDARSEVPQAVEMLTDELAVEFEKELTEGGAAFDRVSGLVSFTVWNKMLFPPGKVDLKKSGREFLERLSEAVKNLGDLEAWEIRVAGHTDNLPPGKSMAKLYPTNWEMSQARAVNVLRYLVDKGGLPPHIMSAVGYGEQRPLVSNETREGRSRNLRIVIEFDHKASVDSE